MEFDVRRALTYLRKDLDYRRKLLIVGVVSIVPFANCVILGYGVNIYRNLVSGKKDSDLQPEWGSAGDFILKGVLAACIALVYGIAAGIVCAVLALVFGIGSFAELLSGGQAHISVAFMFLVPLVLFAFSLLFWSGYSLYSESLELSRAFRMVEVCVRIQTLGKSFLMATAGWLLTTSLVVWVLRFIPRFGDFIALAFAAFIGLFMVHIVGQLTQKRVNPVLNDIVNTGYMEYTESVRAESAKHEDAFGYQKQGGQKASHYADHQAETSLTWSTDSDVPEE